MRVARGLAVATGLLLVLGLLFVWIALPQILGGVAIGVLRDNGVQADDLRVEVAADPPLKLIGLRADRVRVRAGDLSVDALSAESVDVTLRGVDLRGATFEELDGRLEGVEVVADDGTTLVAKAVDVTGTPEAAHALLTMDAVDVERTIRPQVARSVGAELTAVTLVEPNLLIIDTSIATVRGTLDVDGSGALVFRETSGNIAFDLFRSTPDQPVRVTDVAVVGDELQVTGTVDLLAARP